MSDNVCPYCKAERGDKGIIYHVYGCPNKPITQPDICPLCGKDYSVCEHAGLDFVAEIARLKAELEMTEKENALWRGHVQKGSEVIAELYSKLEKAERRIEQLMEAGRQQEVEIGGLVRAGTTVMKECDEARKLAQKYYALWRMAESEILRILKIGRQMERE